MCELTALIASRKTLEAFLALLDQGMCQIQASLGLPTCINIFKMSGLCGRSQYCLFSGRELDLGEWLDMSHGAKLCLGRV